MKMTNVNWDVVETISKQIFPDEYKTVTRKQLESIENKISNGLPPIAQSTEVGGMHSVFGGAMENMGSIITAISIIVTWYTWKHPKHSNEGKNDYHGFLDYLKENPETSQYFTEIVNREVKRNIEKEFAPILNILEEMYKKEEQKAI